MKRREFIKTAAGIWIPNIWIQRAEAQFQPGRSRSFSPIAASGCATLRDSNTVATSSYYGGTSSARIYMATKVLSGSGPYTYCSCDLMIYKIGSPTMDLTVELWSHDGTDDDPSSIIGTGSSTVSATSLGTTDGTWVSFADISSTPSTYPFWVVMRHSSAGNASNAVRWSYGTLTSGVMKADGDGIGVWPSLSTGNSFKFRLYSA